MGMVMRAAAVMGVVGVAVCGVLVQRRAKIELWRESRRAAQQPGIERETLRQEVALMTEVANQYPPRSGEAAMSKVLATLRPDGQPSRRMRVRLGSGVIESAMAREEGSMTCETSIRAHEGKVMEAKTSCRSDHWEKIASVMKLVEGPNARHDPSQNGVQYEHRDEAVVAAAAEARARALGPMTAVDVPPELSAAYATLTSAKRSLTLGRGCGVAGRPPEGYEEARALQKAGRLDLLRNVARGPNPGGQVYGALILARSSQEPADLELVEKVKALDLDVVTCNGCSGKPETAAAVFEEWQRDDDALKEWRRQHPADH